METLLAVGEKNGKDVSIWRYGLFSLICELIKSLLIVRFHRLGSVRQQCCRKHSMEAHHFRNRWP